MKTLRDVRIGQTVKRDKPCIFDMSILHNLHNICTIIFLELLYLNTFVTGNQIRTDIVQIRGGNRVGVSCAQTNQQLFLRGI